MLHISIYIYIYEDLHTIAIYVVRVSFILA